MVRPVFIGQTISSDKRVKVATNNVKQENTDRFNQNMIRKMRIYGHHSPAIVRFIQK